MYLLNVFSGCYPCELLLRITLPPTPDRREPPPQNKTQPTAVQLKGNQENPQISGPEQFENGTISHQVTTGH